MKSEREKRYEIAVAALKDISYGSEYGNGPPARAKTARRIAREALDDIMLSARVEEEAKRWCKDD